jgi:hypothetical protein
MAKGKTNLSIDIMPDVIAGELQFKLQNQFDKGSNTQTDNY